MVVTIGLWMVVAPLIGAMAWRRRAFAQYRQL